MSKACRVPPGCLYNGSGDVYVYIYIYLCVYIYIYTYTPTYLHTCMYVYLYIYMSICNGVYKATLKRSGDMISLWIQPHSPGVLILE